ncbi:G-protein coupled receptor Mth2-like 5 [Homarus americanus]|uniref:G-protein coupled receptor Mth2-like 5 n=2 Tax=Homarus americanus TaxID=6706 RepID=A0A8J5TJ07_HOMAM|nr:G-protein coupled receptor Mth2-like 5 [Homarus americanus]
MEDWQDEDVSNLCLTGSPQSSGESPDPVGNLPATSLNTFITYNNYYCAICNNDTQALRVWPTRWECSTLSKSFTNLSTQYVMTNIEFRNQKWGVNFNNTGTFEFHECSLFPVLPEKLKNATRKCSQAITTCGEGWGDVDVADLCQSYTAVVYNDTVPYRNPHCARCNNVTLEQTSCRSQDITGRTRIFDSQAFSLLFDFTDTSGSNVVGTTTTCQESEIWDPFFRKCRSVACSKRNQKFQYDKCVIVGNINAAVNTEPNRVQPPTSVSIDGVEETGRRNKPRVLPTDNRAIIFPDDTTHRAQIQATSETTPPSSTLSITNTAVSSNESNEFLECNKILLSDNEFMLYENGTVFVEAYDRIYRVEEYEVNEGHILVCLPQTSIEKFSQLMGWVSLAGLGLSCVCLLLHLVVFVLVSDLRNLPGMNLASLCLALLISYISFITNVFAKPSPSGCIALAAVMYYFFLSSFTWMNTVAFDIWYTFRLIKTELRVSGGKQWQKFLAYSLYSWLLPAVAVTVLIMFHIQQPKGIPEDYLPSLGKRWCWFGHRKALLVFFAIPMITIIIINSVFFICTARIITMTTSATSTITASTHHKNQYKLYLRLAVLMGFTWVSGIAAGYLQLEAVWYVFVVLNTLQGVFIFLAFTCRSKVWRTVRSRCCDILQRVASWAAGRSHPNSPVVELTETPDHQSPSPITSTDER